MHGVENQLALIPAAFSCSDEIVHRLRNASPGAQLEISR